MDLEILRVTFLAILQGLTEFLPISSSAHIILPKELFGWPDQGLAFDVAVHVGSLIAVVTYFREDIRVLGAAWWRSVFGQGLNYEAKLAWFVLIATIPAGLAGLFLGDVIEQYSRSMLLIAFASIFFAVLLYIADRVSRAQTHRESVDLRTCLAVGLFQVLALIPGTSRSGITITAGLFFGMSRNAAARFSFLLAIPLIAATGLLKGVEMSHSNSAEQWGEILYALAVSACVSFACIHYFLRLIERIGFMPFIIYRIVLGLTLIVLYYGG
jgi:undecaprenyl-diphosphatase